MIDIDRLPRQFCANFKLKKARLFVRAFDHDGPWRRSSFCNAGNCLEVTRFPGGVAVRDSKVASGPVLEYTPEEWRAFVAGVKAGEFDDLGALDN